MAKSSASSRNTSDLRTGKTMPRKVTLPPFPWSHIISGHCRNNSDSIKLSSSRSTCQGRWLRIGNVCSCQRIATDFLANIESLTYDQTLVPSGLSSENKIWPTISVSLPWSEKDSFSSAMCPKASHIFRGKNLMIFFHRFFCFFFFFLKLGYCFFLKMQILEDK